MRSLRRSLVRTVILALAVAPGGTAMGQTDDSGEFPMGTFVANDDPLLSATFSEDGTCRWYEYQKAAPYFCTYATNGDLFTEMTFAPNVFEVNTPATYYWGWDGQTLSFELWGDETNRFRRDFFYASHTYRLVPDPVEVVVARKDAVAGYVVVPVLGVVSAAAPDPDAFTDVLDVKGRIAAVPIAKGQPITPDLLEPAE